MTTPTLETKYVFTITAKIGDVITAGETGIGVRRIIPIIGGEVKGAITGKVLPFGADFQTIRPNELIDLEAKYAFETDDGAVVYVENKGMRFGPVELLAKAQARRAGRSEADLFPHGAEIRDGARKVSLADGAHLCRLSGAACGPRGDRRASGGVSQALTNACPMCINTHHE